MNNIKEFLDAKNRALESLTEAKQKGKVDQGILYLINVLNSSDKFFTTSSCSGRIILIEIPSIGDKINARFLGKWHDPVDIKDIKKSLDSAGNGYVWLMAQPPILHIISSNIENAEKLLKTGIKSGFKNSCIRSIGKKVVVELCSTERMDVPLGKKGKIVHDDDYLQLLCELSNELLSRGKVKIKNLERKISTI